MERVHKQNWELRRALTAGDGTTIMTQRLSGRFL